MILVAAAIALMSASQPTQPFNAAEALNSFEAGREAARREEAYQREVAAAQQRQAARQQQVAHPSYDLATRMIALIDQGRCQDAYNLAVLAGDQAMADRSRGLCTPR